MLWQLAAGERDIPIQQRFGDRMHRRGQAVHANMHGARVLGKFKDAVGRSGGFQVESRDPIAARSIGKGQRDVGQSHGGWPSDFSTDFNVASNVSPTT